MTFIYQWEHAAQYSSSFVADKLVVQTGGELAPYRLMLVALHLNHTYLSIYAHFFEKITSWVNYKEKHRRTTKPDKQARKRLASKHRQLVTRTRSTTHPRPHCARAGQKYIVNIL